MHDAAGSRALTKHYGFRLLILMSGVGSRFDMAALLTAVGAGIGLLAVATLVAGQDTDETNKHQDLRLISIGQRSCMLSLSFSSESDHNTDPCVFCFFKFLLSFLSIPDLIATKCLAQRRQHVEAKYMEVVIKDPHLKKIFKTITHLGHSHHHGKDGNGHHSHVDDSEAESEAET